MAGIGTIRYEEIPSLILKNIPSFSRSEQFLGLDEDEKELPGVVLGSFKSYLLDLETNQNSNIDLKNIIEECYSLIESLAVSGDNQVVNSIVTDVFHPLDWEPEIREKIIPKLYPNSRKLFDQWGKPE